MNADTPSCHGAFKDMISCSTATWAPGKVHKLFWHLGKYGLWSTTTWVMGKVMALIAGTPKSGTAALVSRVPVEEESLNLKPGDWVEVRSEPEIRKMLDANGRYKGLLWMDNMFRFCGHRFRVHKRLERMMLESNGHIRKLKNTVLLEGATCDDLYGCDRSCFHFWREAWLRRVTDEQ